MLVEGFPKDSRVLIIKPGDILCITNLGEDITSEWVHEQAPLFIEKTGCSDVVFFPQDVDFAILRKAVRDIVR